MRSIRNRYDLGDLLIHIGIARGLAQIDQASLISYDAGLSPRFSGLTDDTIDALTLRAGAGKWINSRDVSTHPFAQNTGRRSLARGVADARDHLITLTDSQRMAELRATLADAGVGGMDPSPVLLSLPKKYADGGAWNLGALIPGVISSQVGPARPMSAWAAALIWESLDWIEEAKALHWARHPLYVMPLPLIALDMQQAEAFWRSAYVVANTPHVWARYERQHRISAQALEYYRLDVEYPHDPC